MVAESIAGPLGLLRGGTSGGLALTTTAQRAVIPKGAQNLFLSFFNAAVATQCARIGFCPYGVVIKTQDALATAPTDYSEAAQDGDAATDVDLSSQGTAAQSDFLYIGSHVPFRGADLDVDSVNANASVLTVKYWNGTAWADITATDGSNAAGVALAQDGLVTWTVPTAWVPASLRAIGDAQDSFPYTGNKLYWTRWEYSAALDAATTLNGIMLLPDSTSYFEMANNQEMEVRISRGLEGIAGIEALTSAGTGNLLVGYAAAVGRRFP